MIKISEYDPQLVADIIQFRRETYSNSGRDPSQLDEWSADDFDHRATHVVMCNEDGKIIGAVRIIAGENGPSTSITISSTTRLTAWSLAGWRSRNRHTTANECWRS